MVTFKLDGKYYTAYAQNEAGNPHPRGFACLKELEGEIVPMGAQRGIVKKYLSENNLDYHEIYNYKESDMNTHDYINTLIKFHNLKKI